MWCGALIKMYIPSQCPSVEVTVGVSNFNKTGDPENKKKKKIVKDYQYLNDVWWSPYH